MMYRNTLKICGDLFLSLLLLVLTIPVALGLIVILILMHKGSPIFLQQRPGKDGVLFKIIKFKTMTDERDEEGKLLSDSQRLTKIGKFMRKWSLDELPQLINVLKGEMSIVGPRPFLPEYVKLYTRFQSRRHEVKPGITGWAQVNGRNTITYTEKIIYDVWYVENISLLLDLQILFKTVINVVKGVGINSKNQATTLPFDGTN